MASSNSQSKCLNIPWIQTWCSNVGTSCNSSSPWWWTRVECPTMLLQQASIVSPIPLIAFKCMDSSSSLSMVHLWAMVTSKCLSNTVNKTTTEAVVAATGQSPRRNKIWESIRPCCVATSNSRAPALSVTTAPSLTVKNNLEHLVM